MERAHQKTTYLLNRFKGSNRLIIVDQAHRLGASGIKFLFDFHSATGCPVVLIGNPEIVDVLKENDQQFSRMGPHTQIKPSEIADPKGYAARMIKHLAPRFADCLDLAAKIVQQRGHLRALRKTLILAEEFATSDAFKNKVGQTGSDLARTAFLQAHKHHIRDYEL
jgi:DNA transposition AAA+ family ATPase